MILRTTLLAALTAGLILLAACASTGSSTAVLAPVPAGDCALYAAGLKLMPKVTSLSPRAIGISPTRPQEVLGGESMEEAAGFALPRSRLADASLKACDLGQGREVGDEGIDVTRIAYAVDGKSAAFLFDMPFNTWDALILERSADGIWLARDHKVISTYDPPMRISKEELLRSGALDIRAALQPLPLIQTSPPPRPAPAARPPSGRPWP